MREWGWLAATLVFSLMCIARSMAPALDANVVQDDARQHVFWMLRFRDPELFRDDLIADYFQTLAPPGYAALYRALSRVVDPLFASKLVPPVLGVATACLMFLFARRLAPTSVDGAAGFIASSTLSWYVWQYDDLASGSPRAFLLPTVTALLWALVSGRMFLAVGLTVLGATFYPVCGALAVAILSVRLVHPVRGAFAQRHLWLLLTRDRTTWAAWFVATVLVGIVLLPALIGADRFGPTVSAAEARTMPEFGPGGRNAFFIVDAYEFWIYSYRSGLDLRVSDVLLPGVPILLELVLLAMVLPVLMVIARHSVGSWPIREEAVVLLQVLAASFGLFIAAHVLLFRLYLPARYVQWTVPIVLAAAAGLGLAFALDRLAARAMPRRRGAVTSALALVAGAGLLAYPAHYDGNFVRDQHPIITAYLRAQPSDIVVAGMPTEADLVPSLTGRRVLASREFSLAYHLGYYGEQRRRLEDLVEAYYTDSPRRVAEIAARHGIDLFLLNRAAYDRSTFADVWAGEFEPFISTIATRLRRPGRYALLELADRCSAVDDGQVAAVPARCLPALR